MRHGPSRSLADLLRSVPGVRAPAGTAAVRVHGLAVDSRRVRPGDLFIAIPGHRTDGHGYIEEAVRRGAVAVVAQRRPEPGPGVPVVRVRNARMALAALAAAWYGHPARRLSMVGITGTFGKSATLHILHAILERAGAPAGIIGSDLIGVRLPGSGSEPMRLTTPDPVHLHETLARIATRGGQLCAMEVTSQGLAQKRVHGLEFDAGIFTSLALHEHRDQHGSFRAYLNAKASFIDHLARGAPIIFPADEHAVRELLRGADLLPVSCGAGRDTTVGVRRERLGPDRTRLTIRVRRPLPTLTGGSVPPVTISAELALLGRMNARNATLAAAAALIAGVPPGAVRTGLAAVRPPPRRLRFVLRTPFLALEDTATHPESLRILFEVIATLPYRRLHLVAAIRGGRGEAFNALYGQALGIHLRRVPASSVVATASAEAVDAVDRVRDAERRAFLLRLQESGTGITYRERLEAAIRCALDRVASDDLLVLIGAQGMHAGAALLRRLVRGRRYLPTGTRLGAGRPRP